MNILVDRKGKIHEVKWLLIDQIASLSLYLKHCCDMILFDTLGTYLKDAPMQSRDGAIDRVLPHLTNTCANWDIQMLKQVLTWNILGNIRYDKVAYRDNKNILDISYETMDANDRLHIANYMIINSEDKGEAQKTIDSLIERNVIPNGDYIVDRLKVGTTIVDKNGDKHKVYSMLLTDYDKVMQMVQTLDCNMLNNKGEQRDTMYELTKIALDDNRYSIDEIKGFADDEFCDKAIRVLMDLPLE